MSCPGPSRGRWRGAPPGNDGRGAVRGVGEVDLALDRAGIVGADRRGKAGVICGTPEGGSPGREVVTGLGGWMAPVRERGVRIRGDRERAGGVSAGMQPGGVPDAAARDNLLRGRAGPVLAGVVRA